MKTVLIALSALALSSSIALARDVMSTAPDDDTLGHPDVQEQTADTYVFKPVPIRNVTRSDHVVIQNDPATQPD